MVYRPNSELVAASFLRSLFTPSATFGVGTTLPADAQTWKDGFVQVSIVGGAADIDVPSRNPIVQVDCWIPSINGSKPQWGKANTLAEDIIGSLYDLQNNGVKLSLGSTFQAAHVQSGYPLAEPRRVNNDVSSHARYTFDISLHWVVDESDQTP